MSLAEVRKEWHRVIKSSPHPRLTVDLLRRGIADRLQEAAFGGLPPKVARSLTVIATGAPETSPGTTQLKSGSTLVREWHGRTHTVQVVDGGFEYDSDRYTSLTKIAFKITGAAWSGPRFFGLLKPPRRREVTPENGHA